MDVDDYRRKESLLCEGKGKGRGRKKQALRTAKVLVGASSGGQPIELNGVGRGTIYTTNLTLAILISCPPLALAVAIIIN